MNCSAQNFMNLIKNIQEDDLNTSVCNQMSASHETSVSDQTFVSFQTLVSQETSVSQQTLLWNRRQQKKPISVKMLYLRITQNHIPCSENTAVIIKIGEIFYVNTAMWACNSPKRILFHGFLELSRVLIFHVYKNYVKK